MFIQLDFQNDGKILLKIGKLFSTVLPVVAAKLDSVAVIVMFLSFGCWKLLKRCSYPVYQCRLLQRRLKTSLKHFLVYCRDVSMESDSILFQSREVFGFWFLLFQLL